MARSAHRNYTWFHYVEARSGRTRSFLDFGWRAVAKRLHCGTKTNTPNHGARKNEKCFGLQTKRKPGLDCWCSSRLSCALTIAHASIRWLQCSWDLTHFTFFSPLIHYSIPEIFDKCTEKMKLNVCGVLISFQLAGSVF